MSFFLFRDRHKGGGRRTPKTTGVSLVLGSTGLPRIGGAGPHRWTVEVENNTSMSGPSCRGALSGSLGR